jgi:hypothetical protein
MLPAGNLVAFLASSQLEVALSKEFGRMKPKTSMVSIVISLSAAQLISGSPIDPARTARRLGRQRYAPERNSGRGYACRRWSLPLP